MPIDSGDILAGRYKLGGLIGQGGMGSVHIAFDERSGKRVAVKRLDPGAPEDAEKFRALFRRELKALMLLDHPNVVRLLDHGEADGTPFVVTELLDGLDFGAAFERFGRIPEQVLAALADHTLSALIAAHELGIIHRDIKPANLFLCQTGRVVVLDFGLARGLADGASKTLAKSAGTNIIGTPHFNAPERLQGAPLSPKNDLFSLGASLFFLASGTYPYPGATAMQVVEAMAHNKRQRLQKVASGVSQEMRAAIERLCAHDPAERYPDAVTARNDFLRFSVGDSALAYLATELFSSPDEVTEHHTLPVTVNKSRRKVWLWAGFVALACALATAAILFLHAPQEEVIVPVVNDNAR